MKVDPARLVKQVGRRIASLRAAQGSTQEALAERADISARYLQMIETGRENMTLITLAKLAGALRVDVAELVSDRVLRRASAGSPRQKRRRRS